LLAPTYRIREKSNQGVPVGAPEEVPVYVIVTLTRTSSQPRAGGSLNSFAAWTIDQALKVTLLIRTVQSGTVAVVRSGNGLPRVEPIGGAVIVNGTSSV
jgi:hypothetical protein